MPQERSPVAKMRPLFASFAWVNANTLALSPKLRSRPAVRSQRLTQSLLRQLTLVSTKATGAPSVRMKSPPDLKPTTRSARSRLPESFKPGTKAASDSSGSFTALASTRTPAGFSPEKGKGCRSLRLRRFSPPRVMRASRLFRAGALPASAPSAVFAKTRIPANLSLGRSSQPGCSASSAIPTWAFAVTDQAPSLPGRTTASPEAI